MNKIPGQEQISQALEHIISNKVFKRSSLQERILSFLIEQAIAGNDVKEQTIGIELFKDKYAADQNDSKIRVYVYYLRKKLEEYYGGVGKHEAIRFYIEKGQYNLSFLKQNAQQEKKGISNSVTLIVPKWIIILVAGLMIGGIAAQMINSHLQNNCWKPFFTKQNAPLLVMADHYVVADFTEPRLKKYFMGGEVKNDLDLEVLKDSFPQMDLHPGRFSMFSKMAPYGIHQLNQWFGIHNRIFDIQSESETQLDDYSSNNVIYIGQSKTMQASRSIFLHNSKKFSLVKDGFVFKSNSGNKTFNAKGSSIEQEEYAMVSYQRFENGKHALFFVSNHDIGVLATLRKFTDKKQLNDFYKKLPSSTATFNALYKVSGLQRTEMSCELVELEILE